MLSNLGKLFWEWSSLRLHHKILKRSRVQTKWCAGEIPAGPLPLGLTWGLRQQLVSRVCCCVPKKIYKLKKYIKSLKETLHPSCSGCQHENLSNTCQSRPRKWPEKQWFFWSNGAIWGNFLLKIEVSHRILPFQKTLCLLTIWWKKGRLLKSSDFCGDTILILEIKSQATNTVKGIPGNVQKKSPHFEEGSYEIPKILGGFGQISDFLLLKLAYLASYSF